MTKDCKQGKLFHLSEWWEELWQGMPEFIQEDLTPHNTINVHFADRNDMDKFSKLIGQKITETTQCIWYPKAKIGKIANKRYVTKKYNK